MRTLLSYPLSASSPGWPGNPSFSVECFTSIQGGGVANTYMVHLFNHFASHLDASLHFNDQGISTLKMPFDSFFYDHPLLLDIPKEAEEKITADDLMPYADKIAGADLLLLRTGFERYRTEDPEKYTSHGPGVSSGAARYLMDHFCGSLHAIGLDFISLASYSDVADGDQAHRILLGKYHDNAYINIIEDLKLSQLTAGCFSKVSAVPLLMEGVDSSPVTMWAE